MMCSRIAIAAFAVGMSLAATGIVLSPPSPATAQSSAPPLISRVAVGAGEAGLVEGTSPPGSHVVLRANGRLLGHAVTDTEGRWRVTLSRALEAGDYRLTVTSRVLGVDQDTAGEEVRISVPADGGPARPSLTRVAGISEDEQLRRAGALAEAATRRFDELMSKNQPVAQEFRVAQGRTELPPTPAPNSRESTGDRIRVAQATPGQKPAATSTGTRPAEDDFLAPVWEWLERANRQYQGVIVKQLSEGGPANSLASPAPVPSPVQSPATRPATPSQPAVSSAPKAPATPSTAVSAVPGQPVTQPTTVAQAQPPAKQPVVQPAVRAPAPVEKDVFDQVQESFVDWLDRANRQYQSVIVRRLSDPSPTESAMPSGKPAVPPATQPVAVAQQSTTPPAVQPKAVEDAARLAEQQRREAEAKRAAEAKAKADDDARRAAEAKAKADDDARRAAEAKAKAEDDTRRAAEAKAKADEDARRAAEARAKAEAEKRAAEAKAKADEDARRAAEVKAKAEEDARRAAAAKAKAEEDARRAAEAKAKADEEARRAAEAKAKADEERRVADAKVKADADNRAAAAAAAVAAAAATKAEADRKAAAARVEQEAKRVADAAAAKAQADRLAAETAKLAQAKSEADRRAAELAKKAAEVAAAKPAAPTAPAVVAIEKPTRTAETPAASVRRVGDGQSGKRAATSGFKYAKLNTRRGRVTSDACTRLAGVTSKPGSWYVVKRGDTMWHIAQMHYGDGQKFRQLIRANRHLLDSTRQIYPCQRIVLPRLQRVVR